MKHVPTTEVWTDPKSVRVHYSPIGILRCAVCGLERKQLLNMIGSRVVTCDGVKITITNGRN